MTTQTATPTTSSSVKGAFSLHGLDLNADLVERADATISVEDMTKLDAEITGHWIFANQVYQSAAMDLVKAVREVHAEAHFTDSRSDLQLAACILKSVGLWSQSKPNGAWASAKFTTRLLAAYGRLHVRAELMRARFAKSVKDHELNAVHH